jgi:2-polyprenyl-3-methyl-5-hydroxy-6-metoxy-1,4-benzoquinol methylase
VNPYTEGYFEHAEGSHYHGYEDWPQFKQRAEWLIKTYRLLERPSKVFEIGCAKGYLLKHLFAAGVAVKGCDMSDYAVQAAAHKYAIVADITKEFFDLSRYDVIVSFDLLEHIHEEDLAFVFKTLKTAKQQFHMITTLEYDFGGDHTHYTSKPKQWWIDLFEEYGIKNYRIIHAGEQEEVF